MGPINLTITDLRDVDLNIIAEQMGGRRMKFHTSFRISLKKF